MKIKVIKFGKPIHSAYDELYEHFVGRIKTQVKFDFEVKRMSQGDKILDAEDLTALTGGNADGHVTVLLDEDGQLYSSEQFADKLQSLRDDPQVKQITVVIGGPFGFSAEAKQATKMRWSMSKALMPSDLATVVFLEQLYRGFSILKGTGYHHP